MSTPGSNNAPSCERLHAISWGVDAFDRETGGIPRGEISVVETPDNTSSIVLLAQYLYEGLMKGEVCALISFDSPFNWIENFQEWGMDFSKFIDQDQLIFLNYQANITNEVGLTYDYTILFDEITRLSGGRAPSRIAIQQVDTLINLNNLVLMNQSAQKLTVAVNAYSGNNTSVLGSFVQFNDQVHLNLGIALQKTVKGYCVLERPDELEPNRYLFHSRKLPWFIHDAFGTTVELKPGQGFSRQKRSYDEAV